MRIRKGTCTLMNRRFKKLVGIREWYRVDDQTDAWEILEPWNREGEKSRRWRKSPKPDRRYIESTMFVPHTPGSTLRNRFSKMEQNLGFKTRFKYIEQMGLSIREMVVKRILMLRNVDAVTAWCV